MVLAQSLQGLSGRAQPRLWLETGGMSAVVLQELEKEGWTLRRAASVWDLPAGIWGAAKGAVVFKLGDHSLNCATALSGVMDAAVDESLVERVKARGLEILLDARGMDERQLLERYGPRFAGGIAAEQPWSKPSHLRDFVVARRAFVFGDLDSEFRRKAIAYFGPNAMVYGWGPQEYEWVKDLSLSGGAGLASNWCVNLSALSRLPVKVEAPMRKAAPAPLQATDRVVAFVISDGDNVQWLTGGMALSPSWFGSPRRGEFPLTWELAPMLSELAPRVLRYFYQHATARDSFIAAGNPGYRFIHFEPGEKGRIDAEQSAAPLRASGLRVVSVLNDNQGGMEQCDRLLELPEVDAVLYKSFAPYNRLRGAVRWHAGKPVIAYRHLLWEKLPRGGGALSKKWRGRLRRRRRGFHW